MQLDMIGLLVITGAWIVQLVFSFKDKKEIRPEFIIGYIAGVGLLVAGDLKAGLNLLSCFEIATIAAAALVLVKRLT